jgi:hypothetical protein
MLRPAHARAARCAAMVGKLVMFGCGWLVKTSGGGGRGGCFEVEKADQVWPANTNRRAGQEDREVLGTQLCRRAHGNIVMEAQAAMPISRKPDRRQTTG